MHLISRVRARAVAMTGAVMLAASAAQADSYAIDTEGAHAFISFEIPHLGYSWLSGRFNTFDGSFEYDPEKPEASSIQVTIDTASVDSNHAERDKHLRSEDFLYVKEFPEAKFVSKRIEPAGEGKAKVIGDLTLRGVTREITIDAEHVGGGKDPWGGYRQGFRGTTSFALKDFGIPKDLGPASQRVDMTLDVEGIRK